MQMIEREGIPAPAPIEQRWSSGSKSPLSPASNDGDESSPGLHSWIGIIMYLPTDDETERDAITRAFKSYAAKEEATLGEKYRIRTHWAKIELPEPERSDRGFRVARAAWRSSIRWRSSERFARGSIPRGSWAAISSRRCWGSRIACPWWPSAKFSASRRSTWMRSFDWRAPPAPSGTEAMRQLARRLVRADGPRRQVHVRHVRTVDARGEGKTRRGRGGRAGAGGTDVGDGGKSTDAEDPGGASTRRSRAPREEMV